MIFNKLDIKKLFFLIYLLSSLGLYGANDIIFDRINNSQGLSSDMIYDIVQDPNGFIWIATEDGLNCYTGTEFFVYRHRKNDPQTLSSSTIRNMCVAPDGKIWAGTFTHGVDIVDPITRTVTSFSAKNGYFDLPDQHVNRLLCDSKGRIWIQTPQQVVLYDTRDKSHTLLPNKKRQLNVSAIEDSQGRILMGTWNSHVMMYDEKQADFIALPTNGDGFGNHPIRSLYEDRQGHLWVGTWEGGIYKTILKEGKLEILSQQDLNNKNFSSDNRYNIVYDICQDRNGTIWLGTDVGLGLIKKPYDEQIEIEWVPTGHQVNELMAKDATNLFIDNANTIWIGTQGKGIYKVDFHRSSFTTYTSRTNTKEFSSDIFRSFWYYNDELYAGINALGFGKYDLEEQRVIPFERLPEFKALYDVYPNINTVLAFVELDERFILFMTRYNDIITFDRQKNKVKRLNLPLNYTENSCYLAEKDRIWLGTPTGLMLAIKDENNKNFLPYTRTKYQHSSRHELSPQMNAISSIIRDQEGQLWVSYSEGGIDKVIEDPNRPNRLHFHRAILADSKDMPNITLMFEDSNGTIWVGTEDAGLWQFLKDEKRLCEYEHNKSISGSRVVSMLEDDNKHLWISTNKGLSSIGLNASKAPHVINYSAEDGLQGNIFLLHSAFKSPQGYLAFGGYYGFNYFNPNKINYNNFVPPLSFTHIEVDHEERIIDYRNNEALELTHQNSSIQLTFNALSYTQSKNNQYLYKLEGFDNQWIKAEKGENKANYGKLPAGQYRFMLKGGNNSGIWNDTPISLAITVKKSPFKTVLAYIIYLLIFLSGSYAYFYYTTRNLKLKQEVKEEHNERLRVEKINQFKLKFFTNISHELLTPLSIISNAIEQYIAQKPNEAKHLAIVQRNTNRLTRLINQILDFRKAEGSRRKLSVEFCQLDYIISTVKDNFDPLCAKKEIDFIVKGSVKDKVCLDVDKIEKILHNILSNAFKHTPEKGSIKLEYFTTFNNKNEELTLKISDSGKGIPEAHLETIFERFYRIDDSKHESGAGIGLAFTKSLVSIHKGQIKAENIPDGGALFTVKLPVSEWVYSEDEMNKNPMDREPEYAFAEEMDNIKVPLRDVRESDRQLPRILIVEDNHDMRTILRNFLSKYFEVYESENGLQGLETLSQIDIEIIISDIMMPEMDGLTFCRKVKKNITTSHIPVILTTAKRTEENFIEGYEAQADSYVTKPVNLQLLLVRIINLLNQRSQLREIFTQKDDNTTADFNINNLDQELFEKLNKYIDDNIMNTELSIGMLSEHVGISSSVFYRKIKSYAGMSPNQYLKTRRLNKAAELLQKGMIPSSVTYECGFSDPSYFGVCFKKQFGVSPKKFVEKKQGGKAV